MTVLHVIMPFDLIRTAPCIGSASRNTLCEGGQELTIYQGETRGPQRSTELSEVPQLANGQIGDKTRYLSR